MLHRLRISKGRIDPESLSAHYNRARALAPYRFAWASLAGRTVLDAGCGNGFGSELLSQSAGRVLGIDLDEYAVAYCGRTFRVSGLFFVCGDLLKLPFASGRCDVVLSSQVVEHLSDPTAYFKEIRRVLKKGGLLYLATLNRRTATPGLHPDHVKEYDASEFQELVNRFFPGSSFYGIFGSERYLAIRKEESHFGRIFLKIDPWGLRRCVPRPFWQWVYGMCTLCVNAYVSWRKPAAKELGAGDFEVRPEDLEKAIDFLAVCRKDPG